MWIRAAAAESGTALPNLICQLKPLCFWQHHSKPQQNLSGCKEAALPFVQREESLFTSSGKKKIICFKGCENSLKLLRLPTHGLPHEKAGRSEAGWQPLGKAVTLDMHWGKPDHLEDVLGTDPVLQGGNIICRKLADMRLTAQQEICSCKIPVNSWVLPCLNSLAAVLTMWLSILIPLKI